MIAARVPLRLARVSRGIRQDAYAFFIPLLLLHLLVRDTKSACSVFARSDCAVFVACVSCLAGVATCVFLYAGVEAVVGIIEFGHSIW